MTENLKKFLEEVSKDEALQAKVNALESNKETAMADIIALAKELGIELTEADFAQPDGEISEDELETISGGYTVTKHDDCGCPISGSGTTISNFCYCVAGGGGGGRPDSATSGGKFVEKVGDAMDALPEILSAQLK